jgi:putative oxidoreductase
MSLFARVRRLSVSPWLVPGDLWPLPLRLILGFGFMQHGWSKLSRGPEHFIAILQAIGMPHAAFLGWATVVIELLGGFLVFIGALVPLASAPMIVVLLVAIFTVHLPYGFSSIKLRGFDAAGAHFGQPGYETDLLYAAGLLALCLGGAGRFSVDAVLSRRQGRGAPSQS